MSHQDRERRIVPDLSAVPLFFRSLGLSLINGQIVLDQGLSCPRSITYLYQIDSSLVLVE